MGIILLVMREKPKERERTTVKLKTKIDKKNIIKLEEKKLSVLNTTIFLVEQQLHCIFVILLTSPFGKTITSWTRLVDNKFPKRE